MTTAEIWDVAIKLVALVLAVAGALAGAVKYAQERERDRQVRREELAWRKTQFILELGQDFDNNEQYRHALQMLLVDANLPSGSSLHRILQPWETGTLSAQEKEARFDLDRYMDFFDRLHSFSLEIKTLALQDILCFQWYVRKVKNTPVLREYAEREGYRDVLELADKLEALTPTAAIPHVQK